MDWVKATLIGVAILVAAWAAPILGGLLSVLFAPLVMLAVIVFAVWFLLQILKDGDDTGSGRGP